MTTSAGPITVTGCPLPWTRSPHPARPGDPAQQGDPGRRLRGSSPDGLVTDDLVAFHRAFAGGGVGMTTVATAAAYPARARVRPVRS